VNDPNQFANRYVAVWNEPDPDLRSKAIAEIFGDQARYCNARTEITAAAWCTAITLVSFLWAKTLYNRNPAR